MKQAYRTLRELLPLLPGDASRFLAVYALATSALSLLDILALGLLALVLTPLINHTAMSLPLIGTVPSGMTVWVLGAACLLTVLKSVVALVWQWIGTRRLARYELAIGDRLFDAYLRASWTDRISRSTAELVRLADVGIANTMGGFLLPAVSLPGELFTFVAVLVVLVVAQPLTAAITVLYLGVVGGFLYMVIARKSLVAGAVNLRYGLAVNRLMTEMVSTLKEIVLRDKLGEVASVVHDNRIHATRARAHLQFLGVVPKYVIEAALIVGFLVVGLASYLTSDMAGALSAVALFGIAGFRIVPSVVRFQSLTSTMAASIPHAEAVMGDIAATQRYSARAEHLGDERIPEPARLLEFRRVGFTYPGATAPALHDVDLTIPLGTSVALVGASGAGKSTLVDLLLGLLRPTVGDLRLDGIELDRVMKGWRSRVGYVPQDVALFDGTIAQNVALTWGDDADESRVRLSLERAQMLETVLARPGGIHARIGERGLALSGGQRQRIGIARALYTDPLVLVLDEATSALDTATEEAVTRSITELHGRVTVVAVAHRLSTIRNFDQICFMDDASVREVGTFDELVAREPTFALQARLAGLAGAGTGGNS